MRPWLGCLGVALVVVGCRERTSAPPSPAPAPSPLPVEPARVDASDLVAKFECNRCHDVPGIASAPREKHCVACHQAIQAGTFPADADALAAWRSRITSLRWAPSLAAADRLRRGWVRAFLRAPHDVRPGLPAQMPRLAISDAEADRLAAFLVPVDDPGPAAPAAPAAPAPSADELARGEQLYRGLGCARCHRFTGASVDDPAMHEAGRTQPATLDGAWALAPDLRHARDRIRPGQLAAWIAAPRGAMPNLGVSADDARRLAAFIAATPLAAPAAHAPVSRPPRLARRVTWDEVESKVFRKVCWHCHAVADYALGDGGPGNTGGFGFAPRGLDLSSYAGISAGSVDDAGEPRSIFALLPDGTPRLVAHLLARHAEQAGQVVDGIRGMPLGLPALSLEQIQLVDTWIAQGRPQ